MSLRYATSTTILNQKFKNFIKEQHYFMNNSYILKRENQNIVKKTIKPTFIKGIPSKAQRKNVVNG